MRWSLGYQWRLCYITFMVLGALMRRTWVGHLKGTWGSNEMKTRRILWYHIQGAWGSNEKKTREIQWYHIQGAWGSNEKKMGMTPEGLGVLMRWSLGYWWGLCHVTFRVLGVLMKRTWVGHLKGVWGSNEMKTWSILWYHIQAAWGSNEMNMGKTPESARGSNEKKLGALMRPLWYHIEDFVISYWGCLGF